MSDPTAESARLAAELRALLDSRKAALSRKLAASMGSDGNPMQGYQDRVAAIRAELVEVRAELDGDS